MYVCTCTLLLRLGLKSILNKYKSYTQKNLIFLTYIDNWVVTNGSLTAFLCKRGLDPNPLTIILFEVFALIIFV